MFVIDSNCHTLHNHHQTKAKWSFSRRWTTICVYNSTWTEWMELKNHKKYYICKRTKVKAGKMVTTIILSFLYLKTIAQTVYIVLSFFTNLNGLFVRVRAWLVLLVSSSIFRSCCAYIFRFFFVASTHHHSWPLFTTKHVHIIRLAQNSGRFCLYAYAFGGQV